MCEKKCRWTAPSGTAIQLRHEDRTSHVPLDVFDDVGIGKHVNYPEARRTTLPIPELGLASPSAARYRSLIDDLAVICIGLGLVMERLTP
jgi:hypothetical protein